MQPICVALSAKRSQPFFGDIETKLEICGRACIVNKDRDYLIILHLSNIGRPRTELARLLPE